MIALVLVLVVLEGCGGVVGSIITTTEGLRSAGFATVSVTPRLMSDGSDGVGVGVTVAAPPSDAAARTVAQIVYQDLQVRFDVLDITVHGQGPAVLREFAFADLVAMFGARNPAYNQSSITSSTENLGVSVLVGLGMVVALTGAIAVFFVVRRRRRPPPPPWSGFHPGDPVNPAWENRSGAPPAWGPGTAPFPPVPSPDPVAWPGRSDEDGSGGWGAPVPPK